MTGGQATLSLSEDAAGMTGEGGGTNEGLSAGCQETDNPYRLFGPRMKSLSAMKPGWTNWTTAPEGLSGERA